MKKIALMLALAMPLTFASCGDEENDEKVVSLDKTSVEISYKATNDLKASEKGGTWGSDNEFVATVDNNGKITAKHVGSTVITYTKDGASATCNVKVTPVYTDFTFPVMNWGLSKTGVKSEVPNTLTLYVDDDSTLAYTTNGVMPFYVYTFVNNALASSSLSLDIADDDNFTRYFEQYFQYIKDDENGEGLVYADANTLTDAETALVYSPLFDENGDVSSTIAVFSKVQHSRSGEGTIDIDVVKANKNVAREMAK